MTIQQLITVLENLSAEMQEVKSRLDNLNALPDFIPVSMASYMINRTPQTVRNLTRQGILGSKQKGGVWLVNLADVKEYKKNNIESETTIAYRQKTAAKANRSNKGMAAAWHRV